MGKGGIWKTIFTYSNCLNGKSQICSKLVNFRSMCLHLSLYHSHCIECQNALLLFQGTSEYSGCWQLGCSYKKFGKVGVTETCVQGTEVVFSPQIHTLRRADFAAAGGSLQIAAKGAVCLWVSFSHIDCRFTFIENIFKQMSYGYLKKYWSYDYSLETHTKGLH